MLAAILLAGLFDAVASITQPSEPDCIFVSHSNDAEVALEGRLMVREFPGPPNYEDVRLGDTPERASILELTSPICVANGTIRWSGQAHLFSTSDVIRRRLGSARGHWIRIRGKGFGAITGHHRAPLVVDVRELTTERR